MMPPPESLLSSSSSSLTINEIMLPIPLSGLPGRQESDSSFASINNTISCTSGASTGSSSPPRVAIELGPAAIVCGRGRGCYSMPGNIRFRALVQEYVADYAAAKTKMDKSIIMYAIVEAVQAYGGTFVKKNPKTGAGWYEISEEQAREKVGHALRLAVSEQSLSQQPKGGKVSPSSLSPTKKDQQKLQPKGPPKKPSSVVSPVIFHDDKRCRVQQSTFTTTTAMNTKQNSKRWSMVLQSIDLGCDPTSFDMDELLALEQQGPPFRGSTHIPPQKPL